jgi:transposase
MEDGCCGKAMYAIGEETSEQLDYRPASLVRVQTARIKYAVRASKVASWYRREATARTLR